MKQRSKDFTIVSFLIVFFSAQSGQVLFLIKSIFVAYKINSAPIELMLRLSIKHRPSSIAELLILPAINTQFDGNLTIFLYIDANYEIFVRFWIIFSK